jgi:DNA-binding response OmpR family regulator
LEVASTLSILLVEDDESINGLIHEVLETDLGARVESFTQAEPALAYLRTAAMLPSLLIVDLMLPGLDGEGFMLAVRESFGPDLPIMVVSAAAPPRGEQGAKLAAAQACG